MNAQPVILQKVLTLYIYIYYSIGLYTICEYPYFRMLKISKPDPAAYKVPMTRVSTNASTLPMFANVSNSTEHDSMNIAL